MYYELCNIFYLKKKMYGILVIKIKYQLLKYKYKFNYFLLGECIYI